MTASSDSLGAISPSRHIHHLKLIVPVLDRHGHRVGRQVRSAVVAKIKESLSDWAGGFTASVGYGGWVTPDGQLMEEPVTLIEAYGARAMPLGVLGGMVELIMTELDQEVVAVVFDGALLLYGREFVDDGEVAS